MITNRADSSCTGGRHRGRLRSLGHNLARAGVFLLLASHWGTASSAAPVVVSRGEPQLFVDDKLISESHALLRTLHQPRKDGGGQVPVIPALDQDGTLQANVSIIRDPRLNQWVMYCLRIGPPVGEDDENGWKRIALVRFVSEDGMNWRSESKDGFERVFPKTHGDFYFASVKAYSPSLDCCSVIFEASDKEWPYKAWFWLSGGKYLKDLKGSHYYRSKDGRTFEHVSQAFTYEKRRLTIDGREFRGPSDTTKMTYDPVTGRFLGMIKFYMYPPDKLTGQLLRSRAFMWFDKLDQPLDLSQLNHIELLPQLAQAKGDFPFDEYYDTTAYRYGSHWLGELKVWHSKGNYVWSAAGSAFFKFMSSDDGLIWRRAAYVNDSGYSEIYLANGPEGGNNGQNDGGYMTFFCNPPLRIADELIFYYGSTSYGKNAPKGKRLTGGGVFRARLRVDGFVSVDFGQLTTQPLEFAGDELRVNSKGNVTAEVIDATGAVLGTAKIKGDALRQVVRFDGKSLRELQGPRNGLKLRFTVESDSALYAFVID